MSSLTHTGKDVHEFKNTGIILIKLPTRMLGTWALIFTMGGKKEIIRFTDLHFMKHTSDGLTIVSSTIEAIAVYNIQFDHHELICTIDLFDWIMSIVSPSNPS